MSDMSLAIRFTEENYADRKDVVRGLGTSMIDPIWASILSYRSSLFVDSTLKDITKESLQICLTNSIKNKLKMMDETTASLNEKMLILKADTFNKPALVNEVEKTQLNNYAKSKGISVNDIALDNVISGRSSDLSYARIVKYYRALKFVNNNPTNKIDENYLECVLESLVGNEISSLYRTKEITAESQNFIINKEYEGAPVHLIQQMMDSLLKYLNDKDVPSFIKVSVVHYMINYIKPFEKYNEEMALLLARAVLLNVFNEGAKYISFEIIDCKDILLMKVAKTDVQRYHDLTYVISHSLSSLELNLNELTDKVIQLTMSELNKTALLGDDQEQIKKEFGKAAVTPKEEPIPVIEKKVNDEPRPIIKQPKVEKVTPVRTFEIKEEKLSEKEYRHLANELLETNPSLKKGQAHFYVRHCTKGRYYTIQQYKKEEGCVYETARTSMDNLAQLGYYKREQVKNKFVYTPITK